MTGDFSITRSIAAPLLTLASVAIVADFVLMGSLFIFGLIERGFDIDADFTFFYWLLFLFNMFLVLYATFVIVKREAGTLYYVENKQLILRGTSINKPTENYSTDLIRQVAVDQSFFGRRFNYGNVNLVFGHTKYEDQLVLKNVENPVLIADLLHSVSHPRQ